MGCFKMLDQVNNSLIAIKVLVCQLERNNIDLTNFVNQVNFHLERINKGIKDNCLNVDRCKECWTSWMNVKQELLKSIPREILDKVKIG